jgi:DNA-binding NarL/FixJ family response regulator
MIAKPLTKQQTRILTLARDGMPLKTIASELNLSRKTVQVYSCQIRASLSAENLTHAVVIAVRCGFIPLKGGENARL